jgi:hypothetical protein
MGKTRGLYNAEFPEGSLVKVVSRPLLERFRREWNLHNKLEEAQIHYADATAPVTSVGYYHGGDELYMLEGVPGIWHEECLNAVGEQSGEPAR